MNGFWQSTWAIATHVQRARKAGVVRHINGVIVSEVGNIQMR